MQARVFTATDEVQQALFNAEAAALAYQTLYRRRHGAALQGLAPFVGSSCLELILTHLRGVEEHCRDAAAQRFFRHTVSPTAAVVFGLACLERYAVGLPVRFARRELVRWTAARLATVGRPVPPDLDQVMRSGANDLPAVIIELFEAWQRLKQSTGARPVDSSRSTSEQRR